MCVLFRRAATALAVLLSLATGPVAAGGVGTAESGPFGGGPEVDGPTEVVFQLPDRSTFKPRFLVVLTDRGVLGAPLPAIAFAEPVDRLDVSGSPLIADILPGPRPTRFLKPRYQLGWLFRVERTLVADIRTRAVPSQQAERIDRLLEGAAPAPERANPADAQRDGVFAGKGLSILARGQRRVPVELTVTPDYGVLADPAADVSATEYWARFAELAALAQARIGTVYDLEGALLLSPTALAQALAEG
ncbi:MAG: hypothetical protein AAFV62_03305 [Pseudomonadota bacterium]